MSNSLRLEGDRYFPWFTVCIPFIKILRELSMCHLKFKISYPKWKVFKKLLPHVVTDYTKHESKMFWIIYQSNTDYLLWKSVRREFKFFLKTPCHIQRLWTLRKMFLLYSSLIPYKHWLSFAFKYEIYEELLLKVAENTRYVLQSQWKPKVGWDTMFISLCVVWHMVWICTF